MNARWLLTLTCMLLAGCQANAVVSPRFELNALAPGAGGGPATATSAAAGPVGELRIDVATALRSRVLLSTLADVDHASISLHGPGGASATQDLTAAQLSAGQKTFVFTALAVGAWTYSVKVYDVQGHEIGLALGDATVIASQTTTLPIQIQLSPTTVPTPVPSGSGSGGGGSSTATGGLNATLTFQTGLTATPMQAFFWTDSFPIATEFLGAPAPGQGGVLLITEAQPGKLSWVQPTGQVAMLASTLGPILLGTYDALGALWLVIDQGNGSTVLTRRAPGSDVDTVLTGVQDPSGYLWIRTVADGSVWVAHRSGYVHVSAAGAILGTVGLSDPSPLDEFDPGYWHAQAVDAAGNLSVIVVSGSLYHIEKFSAAGAPLGALSNPEILQPEALAVDSTGSLWVMNGMRASDGRVHVVRVDASGATAGDYASDAPVAGIGDFGPADLVVDQDDHVWLAYGSGFVTELSLTGQHLALRDGGAHWLHGMRVDGAGNLWALDGGTTLTGFHL